MSEQHQGMAAIGLQGGDIQRSPRGRGATAGKGHCLGAEATLTLRPRLGALQLASGAAFAAARTATCSPSLEQDRSRDAAATRHDEETPCDAPPAIHLRHTATARHNAYWQETVPATPSLPGAGKFTLASAPPNRATAKLAAPSSLGTMPFPITKGRSRTGLNTLLTTPSSAYGG